MFAVTTVMTANVCIKGSSQLRATGILGYKKAGGTGFAHVYDDSSTSII